MASFLARIVNGLAELLPESPGFGPGGRLSSPVGGTCYQVRSRIVVPAVLLPLGAPDRRFEISLAPTTRVRVSAATPPGESYVYAELEVADLAAVIPESVRAAALTTGFLLEVSRRDLSFRFVPA